MGFVLDSIVKYPIFNGPETIDAEFISDTFDISGIEDDFSIQVTYENGVSFDADLVYQLSTDGINFSDVSDSLQNVSDTQGSHIWDVESTGVVFLRVKITVNVGSADLTSIIFSGKRRH